MENKFDIEKKYGKSQKLYSTIVIAIAVVMIFTIVGQFIKVSHNMPPEAIVYVDDKTHIYYAPPYILGKKYPSNLDVRGLHGITAVQAEKENFKADPTCVEMNYFRELTTLSQTVMVKLGLLEPKPSRWNADGSWNW